MKGKTKEELIAERDEHRTRLQELDSAHAGQYIDPDSDDGKEFAQREADIKSLDKTIRQIEQREELIAEIAKDPANQEEGATFHTPRKNVARGDDIYDLSTVRSSMTDPSQQATELRDRAMRSLERSRFHHPDVDQDEARGSVEMLLTRDTEDGKLARYMLATGSPVYARAFGKYLAGRSLNREEQAAMELAQNAERALSLTGSAGGFAVPYTLDPTMINTSNGVINPVREIARVETIVTDEWRGVTSTGVTAAYASEASEVGDNAPTLAQPTISTEKAHTFVPFSIEVGQDWNGMQGQLAEAIQEAKDVLEAGKFMNGSGTLEPFGILTGAANTVNAAAGQTFTLSNLYSLKGALPPRYRPRAVWLGDSGIFDRVRQFDTVGSATAVWADGLQEGNPNRLLGRPAYEASEMPDNPATGQKFLAYGDPKRYVIVDRVGLTVELIPHLMGANRRPTGERGIYAYWRNGAKLIDANAFRALIGVA